MFVLEPSLAVLAGLVFIVLSVPVSWSWRLAIRYLFHPEAAPLPDERLPRAAVILPLRGADPFLRDCLIGLLGQDYPRYSLHIVIDHADDPAHELVLKVLAEHGRTDVPV